ncbi:MAG TPA: HAD family hydrolase [Myxococcota bacterium]|jgi:phosphoglycolate phosphatase-like HAD superfamily hydrolase
MSTLVALDIDGTLIDTRPSFTRIVKELSGALDQDVERFRDTGGFNDDWELSRACTAWVRAGKPDIFAGLVDVHDCIARVGRAHDPGDLAPQGMALYRGGYWKDEIPLVDGPLLRALAARHRVATCTGRDRWELMRAEEMLGFSFAHKTTMEEVRKPNAEALLRLALPSDDVIVLVGDTAADRMCAENARALTRAHVVFISVSHDNLARPFLEKLARGVDPRELG